MIRFHRRRLKTASNSSWYSDRVNLAVTRWVVTNR